MTNEPLVIQERNLSRVWCDLFVRVMAKDLGPTFLSIRDFGPDGLPVEVPAVRQAVDAELAIPRRRNDSGADLRANKSVDENAYMLFPQAEWVTSGFGDRDRLYRWYAIMERRIHARGGGPYGTYFGRLVNFEGAKKGKPTPINQVEHMIGLIRRGVEKQVRPRFSALQMSILDPAKDHTGQPQRGFPCLQQVSLSVDSDGLSLLAYYPRQSIFERAYGNYLGLCHLGLFIAQAAEMPLTRMDCFIAEPRLGDATKRDLRGLESIAKSTLSGCT